MRRTLLHLLFAAGTACMACASPVRADQGEADLKRPAQIRGLDVEEQTGRALPRELLFTDADGKSVRLGEYFPGSGGGKPAIVALVYYRCPVACVAVLDSLARSLEDLDYTVGREFNTLVFSFNHREGPDDARAKRALYLGGYNRGELPEARAGWVFHTGSAEANRTLADALGYKYKLLENGEYSHPIALFIVTPDGRIARYLYGFSYEPRDLKLALLEASRGTIRRTVNERLMQFCYTYDPTLGRYSLSALRVMQAGGVLSLVGVGGLVGTLLGIERIRRRRGASGAARAAETGGGTGA